MKRPGRPRTDPEKARDWQNRSRRPLPRMSARRRRSLPERDLVRRTVIARHRRRCAAWGIPGPDPDLHFCRTACLAEWAHLAASVEP